MNHSNSSTMPRRNTFFVVSKGNDPFASEKRICVPNTLRVPVFVRSMRRAPWSKM